jgi:uncharacterized protein YjbJ (UPF0337 family)
LHHRSGRCSRADPGVGKRQALHDGLPFLTRDAPRSALNALILHGLPGWHDRCETAGKVCEWRGPATCIQKEFHMDWNRVEGNWKQIRGKVKEQWGKLTDDQLDVIAGRRDQLLGKIQQQYGITNEEAERQMREFEDRFDAPTRQ